MRLIGWGALCLAALLLIVVSVALRHRRMTGRGARLDNRIERSAECARSGRRSLECMSLPPSEGMVTPMAPLTSARLHLARGDDVWFSEWFLVPEGTSLPLPIV